MPTIGTAISTLKQKVATIAERSGRSDLVSAQEVKAAFDAGEITEAQRKVLNQAGPGKVADIHARLDSFETEFKAADNDANGRLDPDERKAIANHANKNTLFLLHELTVKPRS